LQIFAVFLPLTIYLKRKSVVAKKEFSGTWAVLLGGSSGFGLAALEKLASHGMNIVLLYRELASAEKEVKQRLAALEQTYAVQILPINANALTAEGHSLFVERFAQRSDNRRSVRLLLHSIARGNLRSLETLTPQDIGDTIQAMGTSLLDWAKLLLKYDLFQPDSRVIGLTSEGTHKYWDGYSAVSMAKAAMESLARYMAVEFAPHGIRTNLIQAGITDTPSFRRISNSQELMKFAEKRNPMGRMTRPADVADVIYLLCREEAAWINGALIHVDGGEHCR
jgi:enoyl-[acyl-carrier protein] reductase III